MRREKFLIDYQTTCFLLRMWVASESFLSNVNEKKKKKKKNFIIKKKKKFFFI